MTRGGKAPLKVGSRIQVWIHSRCKQRAAFQEWLGALEGKLNQFQSVTVFLVRIHDV